MYRCKRCRSTDVEVLGWIKLNSITQRAEGEVAILNDPLECVPLYHTWCNLCDGHTELEENGPVACPYNEDPQDWHTCPPHDRCQERTP